MSRRRAAVFAFVAASCALFVALTFIAMLAYPGGTYVDPATQGFSFFGNFFSDLGRTATRLGGPQTVSRVLFTTALLVVALGLATFFVAFAGLVTRRRTLARAGSLAGIASALCFGGIALVPANVDRGLHDELVLWAFRCFLGAVLLYIAALGAERELPARFRRTFGAFALLLFGYVLLIEFGPSPLAPAGQLIQATGQKVIVYASIVCVGLQALWARRVG